MFGMVGYRGSVVDRGRSGTGGAVIRSGHRVEFALLGTSVVFAGSVTHAPARMGVMFARSVMRIGQIGRAHV